MKCHATVGVALLILVGCDPEPSRPRCSESDRHCGEDWECVERERPLCPRLCDPTYTCYAQGILRVGWSCLLDSECVEGAYCRDGECAPKECMTDADCREGERCDAYQCVVTLGAFCDTDSGGDVGCSTSELCLDGVCAPPPEEGGNLCRSDSMCAEGLRCSSGGVCWLPPIEGGNICDDDGECADGLECIADHMGRRRCTSCMDDMDCEDPELPHCNAGHCARCSDVSCDPLVCDPENGCVECHRGGDCPLGWFCYDDATCRTGCDYPDHGWCATGQCALRGYCVRELGTPCTDVSAETNECFDGACADRDASGTAVSPYCTRTCDDVIDPPCDTGSTCVERVDLGDRIVDVCLTT